MTSPTLLSLAGRVEQLTGPCRETDILIGYAVDLKGDDKHLTFRTSLDVCGMEQMLRMAESHQNIWRHELPRYTASLDAAMTLVPEGWFWELCQQPVSAKVWTEGNIAYWVPRGQTDIRPATPILALLVAILRARSALEASHG